jgi:hypothetical protein
MSVLGSFASVWPDHGDCRSTPVNGHSQDKRSCLNGAISGLMRCSKLRLLIDHLVCAGEQRRGKIEAEHFSGLEVDDQLVLVSACNASTSNSLE